MVCPDVKTDFCHLEKEAVHLNLARFLPLIFGTLLSFFFFPFVSLSCPFPISVTFLKVVLQLFVWILSSFWMP